MRVVRSPCGNFLFKQDEVPVKGKAVWNQAFVGACESAPVGHSATREFKDPSFWFVDVPFPEPGRRGRRPLDHHKRKGVCVACGDLDGLAFLSIKLLEIHRGEVNLPTSAGLFSIVWSEDRIRE